MHHSVAPLILIPGMGADERLFAPQREVFPNLIVPKWITPAPNDSIQSYGKRLALQVDPKQPCFVGGASFGGFIAMEMARHLQALGVFLIGSLRGAEELPPKFRMLKPIRQFLSAVPFAMLNKSAAISVSISGGLSGPAVKEVVKQFSEADAVFLRWAGQAVLDWEPSGQSTSPQPPIFQIHGQKDPVLSPRCTKPDVTIPGAGHLISLTHPREVNDFLAKHMKS
jgi:pimeloyl-ACP methyl ester carboxylesterase